MLTSQRWRERYQFWSRHAALDTSQFDVAEIQRDSVLREFVAQHHYLRTCPPMRFRFGMYRGAELVGVAAFTVPVNKHSLTRTFGAAAEAVDLGRFVLLDDVPHNGESWFLARCFAGLRRHGLDGVIAFSDPVPRVVDGRTVMPGHVGCIYQAHNGVYCGRARADTLHVLVDGTTFHRRGMAKIRKRERGWRSAAERLVALGADSPWDDTAKWLTHWLQRLSTRTRHPGNHKYAWPMNRALRRQMAASQPYPKHRD